MIGTISAKFLEIEKMTIENIYKELEDKVE